VTAAESDLLVVDGLSVRFPLSRKQVLHAVTDLDVTLRRGEILGVVGESGCGKSTLARVIAGLQAPTAGMVALDGSRLGIRRDRATSRRVQMVFQDPASALNPRMTVGAMLEEVVRVHRLAGTGSVRARTEELVSLVELSPEVLTQRPRNLSGGQRQRVAIARALAAEPELLILDEAIASLDVSVQAAVLALLRRLRGELGVTMLFISHDLGAVRGLCDRVAVMYLGRIVEIGEAANVLNDPKHPYTRALIAAEPSLDDPTPPGASGLQGEPPSAVSLPTGCAFRTRCPRAQASCGDAVPPLEPVEGRAVACYFPVPAPDPNAVVFEDAS
jgi:oligopeptide/dipeptide ABC transporter ATP-binding protein